MPVGFGRCQLTLRCSRRLMVSMRWPTMVWARWRLSSSVESTVTRRRARLEGGDPADDFVSGYDRGPAWCKVSFGQVQVGAADATADHVDPDLARARDPCLTIHATQRSLVDRRAMFHHPGLH